MKNRKKKYCPKCNSLLKIEKIHDLRKKYSNYYCNVCEENFFNYEVVKARKK